MVAMEAKSVSSDDDPAAPVAGIVLSEGAGRALSTVAGRLLKAEKRDAHKRPRGTVLAQSGETQEEEAADAEVRKRERENKRARLRFEANAKVVPDAATDAALERRLLATATRGAVALFNAVAKAQRVAKADKPKQKSGGKPVSRDSFMSMIRAGVTEEDAGNKAAWLEDDFLTAKSRRLKDWETAEGGAAGVGGGKGGDEEESEEESESEGAEAEVEEESEVEMEEEEESE